MAHAFRSAAHIEAENAQRKLERLRDRWLATRDTWFDGSAESVERRIAGVDEVISLARNIGSRLYQAKVGSDALALLPQLQADRDQLTAMRDRITGAHWFDETSPEGQTWLKTLNGRPDPRDYASREEYMQAYGLGSQINHLQSYASPEAREAAREFIEDQNTADRNELLVRAQRFMADRTSTWERQAAHTATREFLAAVADQAPRPVRQASRTPPKAVEDFDDHLMFG